MSSPKDTLQTRATRVQQSVADAAERAGRQREAVNIIAVSKTRTAAEVRQAFRCGLTQFGENYLQDALPKIRALGDIDAQWHFIGPIQSNKTRDVATSFDWVHTLDREKIARRLNDHRRGMPPLNVLLQINVDGDPNKSGIAIEDETETLGLMNRIDALPNLCLRGGMTILSKDTSPIAGFTRMREWFAGHRARPHWDTLSMGMSADFEDAIACGATHVRIGTAIFGPRKELTAS